VHRSSVKKRREIGRHDPCRTARGDSSGARSEAACERDGTAFVDAPNWPGHPSETSRRPMVFGAGFFSCLQPNAALPSQISLNYPQHQALRLTVGRCALRLPGVARLVLHLHMPPDGTGSVSCLRRLRCRSATCFVNHHRHLLRSRCPPGLNALVDPVLAIPVSHLLSLGRRH
jgi:hypothetical protein